MTTGAQVQKGSYSISSESLDPCNWEKPNEFLFASCLCCISPNYMADCPETCEALFQKILEKLVAYKYLPAKEADFLSNTVNPIKMISLNLAK